jgi:O-antigen/teichoic acid export membrane protein
MSMSINHIWSIYHYAKYARLGSLENRTFKDIDILVITVFVPSSLVGIYSIVWTISMFLALFGEAILSTIFPEISRLSTKKGAEAAARLIRDSLVFGGVIVIPGLVGGVILAERLLRLYGPEFTQGTAVMGLLILAVLLRNYQKLLLASMKAIDRPDIAFRVNLVFILVNLLGNVVLVWQFGWVGAAIATAFTAAVGLLYAFTMLRRLVQFSLPIGEIARQCLAAGLMGGVIWTTERVVETAAFVQYNAVIVVSLVGFGASVYFIMLLVLSARFRTTLVANLPLSSL